MVDGKQITVHDLRPGMKLQRTTITTTTERPVRSVRTVQGTVWQVNAPHVIFTGTDGKNKQVKVPEGTKFTIGGEEKTVFDLRKGMKFTATVVTEAAETVVSSTRSTTGSAPPPPKPVIASVPAKLEGPMLIEEAPPPKPAQMAQGNAAAGPDGEGNAAARGNRACADETAKDGQFCSADGHVGLDPDLGRLRNPAGAQELAGFTRPAGRHCLQPAGTHSGKGRHGIVWRFVHPRIAEQVAQPHAQFLRP